MVGANPFFLIFAGTVSLLVGWLLLKLPPETILRFDQRTGQSLYKRAANHELGLQAAGRFYRLCGVLTILFGCGVLVFGTFRAWLHIMT